jgi:O-antigen/teichoic acid export membrane protein
MAQLPTMLIRPVLFLLLIAVTYSMRKVHFSAPLVICLHAGAAFFALYVAFSMLRRRLPSDVRMALPANDARTWVRSGIPLMLMGGMYLVNSKADILMLGSIRGLEMAGLYQVANKASGLMTLVLGSINASLLPVIAGLYASGEMERLQKALTKSARAAFLMSLPIGLFLIFFGNWFLALFGQEFVKGQSALIILCVGQMFNVAAGSVQITLVMTGHESEAARGVAVSAAVNIMLNALLIPKWGINGAALASAISLVLWNVVLIRYILRRLGINTSVLGAVKLRIGK